MFRFSSVLIMLGTLLSVTPAQAQVSPSASKPLSIFAYATATGVENEQTFGKALGEGGGVVVQHSRFVALDLRGYIVRDRQPIHTYLGEAGPRVYYRWRRLRPYGEVLFGLGHSGYRKRPEPVRSAYGLAYSGDLGVDLQITPRFQWRVADLNLSRISAGPGVSPTIISTGVVFRVF